MKISVVIPYLEVDPGKKAVLKRCIDSMKGQYYEVIVVPDDIKNLARKINKGLLLSTGDYIMVCNDDIIMDKGTLKDMCLENYVVTPFVNGKSEKLFHAHMWTMSRKTLSDVGLIWEGYDRFYFDDSDYWMQIEARGYKIKQLESVNILHVHPSRTASSILTEEMITNNRRLFIQRWGMDAFRRIYSMT